MTVSVVCGSAVLEMELAVIEPVIVTGAAAGVVVVVMRLRMLSLVFCLIFLGPDFCRTRTFVHSMS